MRGLPITIALIAVLGTGCAPDREAADQAFRDVLGDLAGELPPGVGKADLVGSVGDDVTQDDMNFAERLLICRVLRPLFTNDPEKHRAVFLNGWVGDGSVLGAHAAYGRETAYDVHHYEAAAFHYYGGGLAAEMAGGGVQVYSGVGVGNHNAVTDMAGPRGVMKTGVEFPIGLKVGALVGGFYLRRPEMYVGGAMVGLSARLSTNPSAIPIRGELGSWTGHDDSTAKLAERDRDLGATRYHLPERCTASGNKLYFVRYGAPEDNHTARGKKVGRAILRSHAAAGYDLVARGMSVAAVAIGVARDHGGFGYLCGGEDPESATELTRPTRSVPVGCEPVADPLPGGSGGPTVGDDPTAGGDPTTVDPTTVDPTTGSGSSCDPAIAFSCGPDNSGRYCDAGECKDCGSGTFNCDGKNGCEANAACSDPGSDTDPGTDPAPVADSCSAATAFSCGEGDAAQYCDAGACKSCDAGKFNCDGKNGCEADSECSPGGGPCSASTPFSCGEDDVTQYCSAGRCRSCPAGKFNCDGEGTCGDTSDCGRGPVTDTTDPGTTPDPGTTGEPGAPVIAFVAPQDGDTVGLDVAVEVQISAENGLAAVALLADDDFVTSWLNPPYTATVPLEPGPHELTIFVEDAEGGGHRKSIQITVAAAPEPEPQQPVTQQPVAQQPVTQQPVAQQPVAPGVSGGCAVGDAPGRTPALLPLLVLLLALRRRRQAV